MTLQVVTQFKNSLVGLTEILMTKEPWYVRCIKPNEAKQPGESQKSGMSIKSHPVQLAFNQHMLLDYTALTP